MHLATTNNATGGISELPARTSHSGPGRGSAIGRTAVRSANGAPARCAR